MGQEEKVGVLEHMLKRKQSKVYTLKRRGGTRACGECTACCTTLRVDALDKPPGTPCVHLGEARCGIYAGRPEECAAFQCCWLAKDPTLPARPCRVRRLPLRRQGPRDG